MTKQITFGTTFWTIAAAATVTALSLHYLGNPWSKAESDTSSSDDKNHIELKNQSSGEETGEVRDSSERMPVAIVAQREPVEIVSPLTPKKPTSAKAKKWKDRLSAKKELKLKLSKKHYISEKAE